MSMPDKVFVKDISARIAEEKALKELRKLEREQERLAIEQEKCAEMALNATKKIISGIDELKAIGKSNDEIINSVKEYLKEVEHGTCDEAHKE